MFPVLMDKKERKEIKKNSIHCPKGFPLDFVKQYEEQILKNHDQDLEKLIERGGLHPTELCAAMYGLDVISYFGKREMTIEQTIFSINMITLKANDYVKRKKKK